MEVFLEFFNRQNWGNKKKSKIRQILSFFFECGITNHKNWKKANPV
jgi:hypothetical protein